MHQSPVVIRGMGHAHPSHKIGNTFFEKLDIESSSAWVEERTGITNRYSVLSEETLEAISRGETDAQTLLKSGSVPTMASLAEKPWQQALKRANENTKSDFKCNLVICGTSVPDYDIPANASVIAANLGIKSTAFDVNSACSSFVTDLEVADALLRSGQYENAAIFNVERYSIRLDYRDRKSCVLFGDGAACTLLSRPKLGEHLHGLEVVDTLVHSDPQGYDAVVIPEGGLFNQNGARVQKFAVQKTCEVSQEILNRNGIKVNELAYFIGHQANLRMLTSAVSKLGLEESQHLYNVDRFGNQGAAGAPVVMSQNWQRFRKDDLVLVAVVGSGLTWGAALLRWV